MKRDWEVIRKILIQLEAVQDENGRLHCEQVTEFDTGTVFYHMGLIIEAGFANGDCERSFKRYYGYVSHITWRGHEWLDSVRDYARLKNANLPLRVLRTVSRQLRKAAQALDVFVKRHGG